MTSLELQRYLHEHIPLSAAMQVSVVAAGAGRVELAAPLAPNINHLATVFGGSASALAILAAWALLQTCLAEAGIQTSLVIQRNSLSYERPIQGDFSAVATAPGPREWDLFLRTLRRKGKARISVGSTLWYAGEEAGRLEGDFVALGLAAHPLRGGHAADTGNPVQSDAQTKNNPGVV